MSEWDIEESGDEYLPNPRDYSSGSSSERGWKTAQLDISNCREKVKKRLSFDIEKPGKGERGRSLARGGKGAGGTGVRTGVG